MSALARWCYRHRLVVVLLWLVALVGAGVAARVAGSSYDNTSTLPGTQSYQAVAMLAKAAPANAGDQVSVVWHTDRGTVRDAAVRARLTGALDRIAKVPQVAAVASPYTPGVRGQISADGRTAFARVSLDRLANNVDKAQANRIIALAEDARRPGLRVELGGQTITQAAGENFSSAELFGLAAAAVVLFVAFGSLLAMALPILTALAGVGLGIMAIELLSHAMKVADLSPTLSTLIGLGVGIDYALFIVTRHRFGLRDGADVEESVVKAVDTSGRAVLFAGGAVAIALMSMFVLRVQFLYGMAVAASLTVVFTVVAALTLLPALLGFMGRRVLGRRERRRLSELGSAAFDRPTVWSRWAGVTRRHPALLSVVALAVMGTLLLPALSLRTGTSDQGNDPKSTTSRQAYDLMARGFGPGVNGPLQIVVDPGRGASRAASDAAVARISDRVRRTPDVVSVAGAPAAPGSPLTVLQVVPETAPQSKATTQLLHRLRDDVLPDAARGTGARTYLTGGTAMQDDFTTVVNGRLWLFITVIVALGCVLLLVAFRSLAVPLTAALMNLLATGASFGVVVAIFSWGWGSEALGLGASGPVEAYIPVMLISILFGLSMDYQVFLVSRMHEEWVHTGDNQRAVTTGQIATGRVITAAATIMVCVFGAFVLGGQRQIGEFGIGLAVAVFLDAFVLRTALVPALMRLLGRANWWLPKSLDRVLPHLSVEPVERPAAAPVVITGEQVAAEEAARAAAEGEGHDPVPAGEAGERR